jgi:hypothetical protein
MSRFRYEILYVKGDNNVVADSLTRMLDITNDQHLGDGAADDLPFDHVIVIRRDPYEGEPSHERTGPHFGSILAVASLPSRTRCAAYGHTRARAAANTSASPYTGGRTRLRTSPARGRNA